MTLKLLEELSNNLLNNTCSKIEDYESIIFKLESMSRKETNTTFANILSSSILASKLIMIGKKTNQMYS